MKLIRVLLRISTMAVLACVLVLPSFADDAKPAPTMPEDITLTSGRVLRKVEVMGWKGDAVIVRWGGRVETVPFAVIKSVPREDLETLRVTHRVAAATKPVVKERLIGGQVFIVTAGQNNHTLGDLTVRLVPKDEMERFLSKSITNDYEKAKKVVFYAFSGPQRRQMADEAGRILYAHFDDAPTGDTSAKTDAEGRFELRVPEGKEFYLYARANRMVVGNLEWYVFLREIKPSDSIVTLSNSDLWEPEG